MIPFHVDPSWYERYWWHDSAPRKPGIFAFFRRILSQQRLTRRQDVRADHQIPHSPSGSPDLASRREDELQRGGEIAASSFALGAWAVGETIRRAASDV